MRPTQKSAPAEAGIESLLAGLRKNERINELEEFAALQTKAAHLLEADKLAKRHALPTIKSCLLCGYGSTTSIRPCRRKSRPNSPNWRTQQETPPWRWTRPRKRPSNVRRKLIDSTNGKGHGWYPTSESVAHLHKALRDTLQVLFRSRGG